MSPTSLLTSAGLIRWARPALAVAAVACVATVAQPVLADAVPAPAAEPAQPAQSAQAATTHLTSAGLLRFEDLRAAGVVADSATLGTRGDQLLGDAGRFDEGCLGEKTMRNITGSKAYPTKGTARVYVDGVWESTQDKDVWVNESIAEGRTAKDTDRYVRNLLDEIGYVKSCEEDPAQGHDYGKAHTVKAGTATATYFYDYVPGQPFDGGGVAVVRDGNRFGFVSLMFGTDGSGATLKKLATTAAANLR
jgi:hypothetical protein